MCLRQAQTVGPSSPPRAASRWSFWRTDVPWCPRPDRSQDALPDPLSTAGDKVKKVDFETSSDETSWHDGERTAKRAYRMWRPNDMQAYLHAARLGIFTELRWVYFRVFFNSPIDLFTFHFFLSRSEWRLQTRITVKVYSNLDCKDLLLRKCIIIIIFTKIYIVNMQDGKLIVKLNQRRIKKLSSRTFKTKVRC